MTLLERRAAITKSQTNGMKNLYDRLKAVGYDRTFVRECVLPDWWSDDLASVPANRAQAEIAIARHFGFRVADLRDRTRPLNVSRVPNVRLRRRHGTTEQQVAPTVVVARRAAELVAESAGDLPTFGPLVLASAARTAILRNSAHVDLASLLNYCWSHGVLVVPLTRIPTGGKKIHGLATFVGGRPAVVLASGHDSPPWIAFHLAHELGHIMCGHVRTGGELLVDHDLDKKDGDEQEQDADRFACELLTGELSPAFDPIRGLTAEKLARAALRYGEARRIAPGTVVLIYGRSANRFPAAQSALKFLGQDAGAREQIVAALRAVLCPDELPETTARFLSGCVGLAG